MFKEERDEHCFTWDMIGDVDQGRPNLGPMMYVRVYRLMQFTLRDVLIKELDVATSDKVFYLDCSGLPVCDETVCTYDEGLISGLLSEYTGLGIKVKEVDCRSTGDRVCRFEVKPAGKGN